MKRHNGSKVNARSVDGLTTEVAEVRAKLALARQEIARREESERRNLALIHKLEEALAHVRKLERLLPICSCCKRIRVEDVDTVAATPDRWVSLEEYICATTDVKLSHGLCADCTRHLYPDLAEEVLEQVRRRG